MAVTAAERAAALYDRIHDEVVAFDSDDHRVSGAVRRAWEHRAAQAIDAAVADALAARWAPS